MCGIVGLVSQTTTVNQMPVERMLAVLAHRGPNHAAAWLKDPGRSTVALGYCRLSIVDLSPAGNQPMRNEAGDVQLVYNGEIYNHAELRRELEASGHQYRSRTDTETIVHAYEEWGTEAFGRLNGMFALALYNQRTNALLLARDRRGIKPLYYVWDGHTLAFASELKALLQTGLLSPRVDPTALWLFLCLGYVPSPYCIVAGVRKLEPGHYLEFREGNVRMVRFTPDANSPCPSRDAPETVHRVREAVERAVQRQLMSDVPVGVFLSGGLDSTIVAMVASRYHREPLHTFSVAYAHADGATEIDARYNEDAIFARQAAASLGTIHHEVMVENNDQLPQLFAELVFQLDEPMVEPVFTSTHYLAKLARQCGVPVVLTGDGADELFGGYDRYFAAQRLATYKKVPGLRWALPLVETVGGSREIARSAHELKYLLKNPTAVDSYIRFSSIYRPHQALQLLSPELRVDVDTEALRGIVEAALGPLAPFVDQMARADLVLWVGEHFNPRLDRISMLHSIEARVPFQDEAVVETALSVPMECKSSRHSRKDLLKRAFADVIPEQTRRRPKRSYQAPGAAWLQGGLSDLHRQLGNAERDRSALFDSAQVRHYAQTWGRDTPGKVFAISALVIADLWSRRYLNGVASGR